MNNTLTARQLAHIFLKYPDAYVLKLGVDRYKIIWNFGNLYID